MMVVRDSIIRMMPIPPIENAEIFFQLDLGRRSIKMKKSEGRTKTSMVEAVAPMNPNTSLMEGTKMTKTLISVRRKLMQPRCLAQLNSSEGNKMNWRALRAGKCVRGTVSTTAISTVMRTMRV